MNNSLNDLILDGLSINSNGSSSTGIYNNKSTSIIINDCNINITGPSDYYEGGVGIYNKDNGNIVMNNGIISGTGCTIYNKALGKIIINDGNISGGDSSRATIYNEGAANVTIKDGIITAVNGRWTSAIYNNSTGEITIDGGNIIGGNWDGYGILNKTTGKVIINGGTITDRSSGGIYNNSTGSVIAKNANFEGNVAIQNLSNAEIELYNCNIKSDSSYGNLIYNKLGGSIKLEKCTIKQTNEYSKDMIVNNNVGNIVINDCNIESVARAICNNSTGKIEIKAGNINSTLNSAVVNNSTGLIIIGENDENVGKELPYIYGALYSIENINGEVEFYDGILKAQKDIVNGGITQIPESYELYITYENSMYTGVLMIPNEHDPVAKIENDLYYTLQDAIDACGVQENTKKVEILRDIRLSKTVKIQEGQNIELDIQGYNLIGYLRDEAISNSGNLKVLDTSEGETGSVSTRGKEIIRNLQTGTLNIQGIKLRLGSAGTAENNKYFIYNEGNLVAENINIDTDTPTYTYGVYNAKTGTATVNSSYIRLNNGYPCYCIYNEEGTMYLNNTELYAYNYYSSAIGIYNNKGTMEVIGGKIRVDGYGSNLIGIGTINSEGNITFTGTEMLAYNIVQNKLTGNATIRNCTISAWHRGMKNEGTGKLIVEGTTITGNDFGEVIDNSSTGEVEINNVNITKSGRGVCVYNGGTGNVKISNSEFKSEQNTIENNGTMEIENSIINQTSKNYGAVYNEKGSITVKGGSITGINYAINVGKGTLTLGEKDGIVSTEIPAITGTTYGVYNMEGVFKFYDGIIKGATAIKEYVSEREEFYDVQRTNENNIQTAILVKAIPEAVIVETGQEYQLLKEAILASQDEQTIKVLKDLEWADETERIEILENQNIKINLNGHLVTAQFDDFIINHGTLEIFDESGKSSISTNNYVVKNLVGSTLKINGIKLRLSSAGTAENNKYFIYNEGNLVAENINIDTDTPTYTYGVYNAKTGTATVNSSYIRLNNGYPCYCIYNEEGTMYLNNTELYAYNYYSSAIGIYNNKGTMEVIGGKIRVDGYGSNLIGIGTINSEGNITFTGTEMLAYNIVQNKLTGNATIRNCTISAWHRGMKNEGTGKLIVEGTTITGNDFGEVIDNSSTGEVEINNVNITKSGRGVCVYNGGTGNVKISNSEFKSEQNTIENNGTMEIENSIINQTSKNYGAVYNEKGSITVKGGSITGINYAINVGKGTLTLGEKDGIVSTEIPAITGTTYGIYNMEGTFNFYDGIIKGTTAIQQYIHDTEIGYDVQMSTDEENIQTAILSNAMPVAEIVETGEKYYTLKEALLECTTSELKTIKMLKNIQISNAEKRIEILENSNVKIDLNGYNILTTIENTVINNGKLEITNENTNVTPMIKGNKNNIFVNNASGILKISDIDMRITTAGTNQSYNTLIYNKGFVESYNVNIDEKVKYIYVWYNVDQGSILASESNITSTGNTTGIYNIGSGKIEITNVSMNLGGSSNGIENIGTSNVVLNNYSVTLYRYNGSYGVYNINGKVEINGGTYNEVRTPIYNENEVIINDINVINSYSLENNKNGILTIKEGNITTGITNYSTNSIIVDGGKIKNPDDYAINNRSTGKIIINAGEVGGINTSTGEIIIRNGIIKGPKYGINNTKANIIVTGGCVEGTNGYGIYNSSGTVTLGEQDSDVNEMQLEVIGSSYGVYNTGTFNFYDGKIKGATSIYSNTVNVPEDYEINKKVVDGIETARLSVKSIIQTVAEINGVYYTTLAAAIRACENNVETTIKLTMQIEINDTLNISEKQNIIIDLNGIDITANIDGYIINNSGTLRIIDTYGGGKIENTAGGEIGGTGTLILGDESGNYVPNIIQ